MESIWFCFILISLLSWYLGYKIPDNLVLVVFAILVIISIGHTIYIQTYYTINRPTQIIDIFLLDSANLIGFGLGITSRKTIKK